MNHNDPWFIIAHSALYDRPILVNRLHGIVALPKGKQSGRYGTLGFEPGLMILLFPIVTLIYREGEFKIT